MTRSSSAGQQLSELFDDVLDTALATIEDPDARREQVAVLAAMARPARVATLASVMGTGEDSVDRLIHDLAPGLLLTSDGVGFCDEDFEQHVHDFVDGTDLARAHERFADYFSARRHTDDEAARLLGEHLFNAGRGRQLVDVVLAEGAPTAIPDGLLRAQTFRSRVSLALRLISQTGDPGATPNAAASADIVRLVLAAADAARTDSSHLDTVRAAPELAVLHSDPSAIAAILTRDDSATWRGKLHMRGAAVLAASGRRAEAAEQLAMAEAWVRAWARQPDRGRPQFAAVDVARAAIAAFALRGADSGLRLVTGWRPRRFVEEITAEFLKLAPALITVKELIHALRLSSAGALLQAQAAAAYAAAGHVVPSTWVRQISANLDRLPTRRLAQTPPWGVAFCELALTRGVSRARVRRLLARLGPAFPTHLSDFDAPAKVRPYVQAACLEAATRGKTVDPEALVANLNTDDERPDYADRQRSLFKSACATLLPVLQARADCLVAATRGDVDGAADQMITAVCQALAEMTKRAPYREGSPRDARTVWFGAATAAVCAGMQASARQGPRAVHEPGRVGSVGQASTVDQFQALLRDLADTASTADGERAPWIWMRMAGVILALGLAPALAVELIGRAADAF